MPSPVPNVVGETLPQAVSSIISAGYAVGSIIFESSGTIGAGVIISQDPPAQTDTGRLTDELGGLLETESGQPFEVESGPGSTTVVGSLTDEAGDVITTEIGQPIELESGVPNQISLVISVGIVTLINKVTLKVMSYLHRIFDKNPYTRLAFRVQVIGADLAWSILNGVLTLTPVVGRLTDEIGNFLDTESGGTLSREGSTDVIAQPYTFSIENFTVSGLAEMLAALPGYSVPYQDLTAYAALSALVLMDSSGDSDLSNGDHVYGYTNLLWAYVETNSVELGAAQDQIKNALLQMNTTTAEDEWIDFHGGYYKVPRNQGELDSSYSPRITASVIQPRGNNIAIATAISSIATGAQKVRVIDSIDDTEITIMYNGEIFFDGSHFFDAGVGPNSLYGFFDVDFSYDFSKSVTQSTYFSQIVSTVEAFRDAGTHLKTIIFRNNGSNSHIVSDSFVGNIRVIVYDDYTGDTFRLFEDDITVRLTEDGTSRILES